LSSPRTLARPYHERRFAPELRGSGNRALGPTSVRPAAGESEGLVSSSRWALHSTRERRGAHHRVGERRASVRASRPA
jgi:hypothetical protein